MANTNQNTEKGTSVLADGIERRDVINCTKLAIEKLRPSYEVILFP
jgi:hypothetical protein